MSLFHSFLSVWRTLNMNHHSYTVTHYSTAHAVIFFLYFICFHRFVWSIVKMWKWMRKPNQAYIVHICEIKVWHHESGRHIIYRIWCCRCWTLDIYLANSCNTQIKATKRIKGIFHTRSVKKCSYFAISLRHGTLRSF